MSKTNKLCPKNRPFGYLDLRGINFDASPQRDKMVARLA